MRNKKIIHSSYLTNDLDINYDDLEVQDDKDEILYEAMVDIASAKTEKIPVNSKVLAASESLKRPSDGQLVAAKRRPMNDITNTLVPYR